MHQFVVVCDDYIQKIENAKSILPMSWRRPSVICPSRPGEFRCNTDKSAIAATAERIPPQVTKAPNKFEYQACSIDIT